MNVVYILECQDGSFYTGWTTNLKKRFASHLSGNGAKYTRSHPPLRIAYWEVLPTKQKAMKREWHIKQLSRKEKMKLLEEFNQTRRINMSNLKFYKCNECGKVIVQLDHDSKVANVSCGEKMVELTVDSQNGAVEKHQPVVTVDGTHYNVKIGEVAHVMTEEHYIEFAVVEFENRYGVFDLGVGAVPEINFNSDEKPVAVYAYCNLHGLWKEAL